MLMVPHRLQPVRCERWLWKNTVKSHSPGVAGAKMLELRSGVQIAGTAAACGKSSRSDAAARQKHQPAAANGSMVVTIA
jgi:hypothetical protein